MKDQLVLRETPDAVQVWEWVDNDYGQMLATFSKGTDEAGRFAARRAALKEQNRLRHEAWLAASA